MVSTVVIIHKYLKGLLVPLSKLLTAPTASVHPYKHRVEVNRAFEHVCNFPSYSYRFIKLWVLRSQLNSYQISTQHLKWNFTSMWGLTSSKHIALDLGNGFELFWFQRFNTNRIAKVDAKGFNQVHRSSGSFEQINYQLFKNVDLPRFP